MLRAFALGFHLRGTQHIQPLTEQCPRRKVCQAPEGKSNCEETNPNTPQSPCQPRLANSSPVYLCQDMDEYQNEQILTFISPSLCFILSGESIQQ